MNKIRTIGWILTTSTLLIAVASWGTSYYFLTINSPFNLFLASYIWLVLLVCLVFLSIGVILLTFYYLNRVNKTLALVISILIFLGLIGILLSYQQKNVEKDTEFKKPQTQTTSKNSLICDEKTSLVKAKACTVLIGDAKTGHGSGFFINPNYIVTNLHVVSYSDNGYVKVLLDSGYVDVPIAGYSEKDDLAVLQTKQSYNYCDWASTSSLDLAETLYALGWPKDPYGESTITKGVFSRRLQFSDSSVKMIQTDSPINPGNSGGPLVNKCGVVGINTSKNAWVGKDIPSEGIGYAIDANYAKGVVEQIVQSTVGGPIIPPKTPSEVVNEEQGSFNYNQAVSYDYDSVIYWENRRSEDKKVLDSWKGAKENQFVDKDGVKKILKILERKIEIAEKLWDGYTNGKVTYGDADSLNNEYIKLHNEGVLLSKQLNINGEQNVYVQCIKSWEDLEKEYNQDFTEQKKDCKNYLN
ncbi:trypsin-like serine protease [bacterium]|nr:trypsin-like serine protease [bacterium]